ncbi:helix-turn-helix domain-containing protein [Cupriavidus taiwanensis]|uniref:GlxA family transcriptional regulator n=1 Tax=Cupriavidus taiwanensis TaxID=164546 RepID=UPI002540C6B9|nr:helix-turn-helix domain-containing protein [Cupriavidus taiwanensis]MDK3022382.1 helix-turn-helix domain-containing protein [Cupriavidus taiwanensis]
MRSAYLLVLPGVHLLDLAGPLQVLSTVSELGIGQLSVHCVGPHPGVEAFQGVALDRIEALPARVNGRDLVVVIGSKLQPSLMASQPWRDAAAWLHRMFTGSKAPATTIAAVCTGAFLLGDAGLLDGRLCTTHHAFIRKLRARQPRASVIENRVFVSDGNIWTSAGVASGIDMALRLVAEIFGDEAAIRVARENVVPFRRFSNDPRLDPQYQSRSHGNQLIHAVQDAISRNLEASVSDPRFARAFAISVRHLSRVFLEETGLTPKQYQLALRMARARKLLTASNLSVEEISSKSGFSSVQAFRSCWNKIEPMPPSRYRASNSAEKT